VGEEVTTYRIELTQFPLVKRVLKSRLFQWSLVSATLFFFVLAILTGLFGTPVGNRNFSIIFVWIVWWALVIVLLVPFAGRLWCTMCPIPVPGEWVQHRGFVEKRSGRLLTLGKKWPRRLRNIWLQNFAFLGVALFSGVILTRPLATGLLLLLFVGLALVLSLVFERRTFCRYVCPVGGFIGLYSMSAPIELRVKDRNVCRMHTDKACYLGSDKGYGCPWLVFPGSLERNTYCGLCTECLKTCPLDNVAVNLRPFGTDLFVQKGRSLDEATKGFIMLACALLYSTVLLGPWGWLKDWANPAGLGLSAQGLVVLGQFLLYATGFLGVNLLVVPGLFFLASVASRWLGGLRRVSMRRFFVETAYSLVPLGLTAWIAFSLSFVFVNGSYAIAVLSDPFGWGWDLFGTQAFPWVPVLPELVPYLQVPLLVFGLVAAIVVAYRVVQQNGADERQALRAVVPITAFLFGVTGLFLKLYMG
jgi:hypothetical protein